MRYKFDADRYLSEHIHHVGNSEKQEIWKSFENRNKGYLNQAKAILKNDSSGESSDE